jgi:hypothetical protein
MLHLNISEQKERILGDSARLNSYLMNQKSVAPHNDRKLSLSAVHKRFGARTFTPGV